MDPTGAMLLSVDPVFHPGSSPYAYCLNNPVKLVDPDGMWEQDADGNWIAQKNDNAEMFLMKFDQYVKQPVINNPQLLRKSGWK